MSLSEPSTRFFVVLGGEGFIPTLLSDKLGHAALFDSHDEADRAARGNIVGAQIGYKVMSWEDLA